MTKDSNVSGGNISEPAGRDLPGPAWSLERLEEYARDNLAEARQLESSATIRLYRAGLALVSIRDRLKPEQGWTAWLAGRGMDRVQAWRAIRLAELAPSEKSLAGLTRDEAMKKFAVPREGGDEAKAEGKDDPVGTLDIGSKAEEAEIQQSEDSPVLPQDQDALVSTLRNSLRLAMLAAKKLVNNFNPDRFAVVEEVTEDAYKAVCLFLVA